MTRLQGRLGIAAILLVGAWLPGPARSAAPQVSAPPVEGKYCYLTFDDGPLPGTSEILALSRRLEIPVSMMMIGGEVDAGKRQRQMFDIAMHDPYAFVGDHSYSHASGGYIRFYTNPEGVLADIKKAHESMKLTNRVVRLPGRNIWSVKGRTKYDLVNGVAAAELLAANGFILLGWDVEWQHDPKTGKPVQGAPEMLRDIELAFHHAFTPNHVVILAHDEMFRNLSEDAELMLLMKSLKKRGYIFRTLADYPGVG